MYCPKTPDTWCQYKRHQHNRTNLHKARRGISVDVINAIKPVYANETREDILQKCLHGLKQNPNESFNSTIWESISKTIDCGFDTLELGVYDAVANYNYGRKPTSDIYHHLNIKHGY